MDVNLFLTQYHTALGKLLDDQSPLPSQQEDLDTCQAKESTAPIIAVLLARDRLAIAVAEAQELSVTTKADIDTLDAKLKQYLIEQEDKTADLDASVWRDPRLPASNASWWQSRQRKDNVWWSVLAAFLLTATVALLSDVTQRFLRVLPDFWSFIGLIATALFTFIAGSTFTQAGRDWIEGMLGQRHIRRQIQPWGRLILTIIAAIPVLILRFSLPAIALRYDNYGRSLWKQGYLSDAADAFKRSLSLNPDSANAYYDLAGVEEDLGDNTAAATDYRSALRLDEHFTQAYINLARVLMQQNKKETYYQALLYLNRAEGLVDKVVAEDPNELKEWQKLLCYSLYKNRAWAYSGLAYDTEAKDDAELALAYLANDATAHCLLAHIYRRDKSAKGTMLAKKEADACVSRYDDTKPDGDPAWFIESRRYAYQHSSPSLPSLNPARRSPVARKRDNQP